MLGEDELLLGALDGREELCVVRLLELLAGLVPSVSHSIHQHKDKEKKGERGLLTTLLSCASATRFSASALTSSCSNTTSLVLSGSLNLTF